MKHRIFTQNPLKKWPPARWLSVLVILLALFAPRAVFAQGDASPVVQIINGNSDPIIVVAGVETSVDLSAIIAHEPVSHAECTLTDPQWVWTAANADIDYTDDSATLKIKFNATGDYQVSATAKVTYTSSCSTDGVSGSDTIHLNIKAISKHWEVGTEVGKDVDEEGHAIDNGRITSPQDQTKNPPLPDKVFIPLGKSVDLSVEDATDNDKWTLDLNNDGAIDPDPAHGETGIESDEVGYKWSGDGTFGNKNVASTTWTTTDPGVFTLTCAIDDKWGTDETGVTAPETGTRNDSATPRTVTIVVYTANLKVSRDGVDRYGSDAIVAAGAKDTSEHKASIHIEVTPPVAGVPINKPEITHGDGVGKDANINMDSATTDEHGRISGTFTSSDKALDVTLQLHTDQSGDVPQATIHQHWNDDLVPWDYEPYFTYDEGSSIDFQPRYKDNDTAHTMVNITGHQLNFRILNADVFVWDDDEGTYVEQVYTAPDDSSILTSQVDGATTLAEFDMPQPKTDAGDGNYHSNLTVYWNIDEIIVWIGFRAQDDTTYQG